MRRWQQISSGTCKVNTTMRNYTEISLLLTFYLIGSMVLNVAVSKLQRCHFRRRYRYFFIAGRPDLYAREVTLLKNKRKRRFHEVHFLSCSDLLIE